MLLKAWKVACVDGHTGMLLRNISLNIAKNPCLTRVFVAWHHGVKNVYCMCPGRRVGTVFRTSQKWHKGQFLASKLVSNGAFFEFFSFGFV